MDRATWDDRYRTNFTPWDIGVPDANLTEYVSHRRLDAGRALEVGCGTGTNARWLAEQGLSVVAVDLSPLAIERAKANPAPTGGSLELHCLDFLSDRVPGAPFDLVFDRGCFHVFDDADERAHFVRRVAELLSPTGRWLSLIGSTEGAERDVGPPRRSARDIVHAIEPELAIEELRATRFQVTMDQQPTAWACISTHRSVPAQPSTRR